MPSIYRIVLVLFACLLSASSAVAQNDPVFVDRSAAPCGNGSSWQTAFNDLQPALNWVAGQSPGSGNRFDLWIAAGTYHPHDKPDGSIAFAVPTHVRLLGGFAGSETDPDDRDPVANVTILHGVITPWCLVSCQGTPDQPVPCFGDPTSGPCFSPHTGPGCSEEVCCAAVCAFDKQCCQTNWDQTCVLLAGDFCNSFQDPCPGSPGWGSPGGDPPYPTLGYSGSVVGTSNNGIERWIDGFTITEGGKEPNGSSAIGGGVSVGLGEFEVIRCVVIDNQATEGGGIAIDDVATRLTVWNSQIVQNRAESNGGGVYAEHPYDLFNSIVARNGLGNCLPGGDPTVCPTGEGGGIYDQMLPEGVGGLVRRLVNCTITQNIGGFHPGFIQFGAPVGDTSLKMVNTIIYHNELQVTLDPNCSLPNPPVACPTDYRGQAVFIACDVDARGTTPYAGTVDKDPIFKSLILAAPDYRLDFLSPCLNAGNEAPGNVVLDLRDVNHDGDPAELDPDVEILARLATGPAADCVRIDIGAHESHESTWCFIGDLDHTCMIDGSDLGLFLANWGGAGPGDFDCSGVIDGDDLGILLSGWGSGPPCCGQSMMAGMAEGEAAESSGQPLTPGLLVEALGFSSIDELSDWLAEQPYETMVGLLELLGG